MTTRRKLGGSKYISMLDKDLQGSYVSEIDGSSKVFEILEKYLKERLGMLEEADLGLSLYDSPAYPYLKADISGAKREVKEMLKLIVLKEV